MWAVRPLEEAGIEPVRLLEMCPGTDMVTRYVGRSYYVLWVEDLEIKLLVGKLHGRQVVCTSRSQACNGQPGTLKVQAGSGRRTRVEHTERWGAITLRDFLTNQDAWRGYTIRTLVITWDTMLSVPAQAVPPRSARREYGTRGYTCWHTRAGLL